MELNEQRLTVGQVYSVHHKRKGHFVALLTAIVDAPPDDLQDDVFLTVRYDVRHGTDQEHLATQPKQKFRESNLRPSLVLEIQEYAGDHWLREVAPPPIEDKSRTGWHKIFKRR